MSISPLNSAAYTGTLKIDPSSFDASVCSLLICLDGEKYIDIFRSRNISQETLMELTDDDLRVLGIDDPNVRAGLVREIKNFPLYEQLIEKQKLTSELELSDISNMLRDSNLHIHRVYLSILSVNMALRRRCFTDVIVGNKRATTVLTKTLDEIVKTLDLMEDSLHTKFQCLDKDYKNKKQKKILVGTLGSIAIAVLTVLFVQSLKYAR